MNTEAVDRVLPSVINDLKELIKIPSISSLPDHDSDVEACANRVAQLLTQAKCPQVKIVKEGGKPAVIGHYPAPEGQPTVCLYAHYDVQPTGDLKLWTNDPFVPTEHDDRLFARGAADDKGGFGVHLAALRAFDGKPPVGVTLFIEGEEEIGSPTVKTIIEQNHELLESDVFVITDSVNWQVGEPAFTTQLRGMARLIIEVSTLDHALHSGQFGGVVPDAMMVLIKLLATLHDDEGNVAVEGLEPGKPFGLDYPEDRLKEESGLLPGVSLIGSGPTSDRMWTHPALTVIGLDATSVALASNTLAPTIRAMIGMRIAPGRDATAEAEALKRHLETHALWGGHVKVQVVEVGQPSVVHAEGPYYDAAYKAFTTAFGTKPIQTGTGGSIPLVSDLQAAFPKATILLTAVVDPDSRMHGIDESLHLGDFARACRAETLFLASLAQ